MATTVADLLEGARRRLRAAPFGPSTREARLLLGRVLELDEAALVARSREAVPAAAAARFEELLRRRLTGEPVAYLLGEREFWGRRFRVDPRVLVPRPESEHLIEAALALGFTGRRRILDIGTGSGCLAITLALELPGAEVVATDASIAALRVAAANVREHRVGGRVRLTAADLATGVSLEGFDLVVSNPPYLAPEEAPSLSPEVVGFEPAAALFAGGGGLALVRRLLDELAGLRPGTPLLIEIGAGQEAALRRLAAASAFRLEGVDADLAGRPRVARLAAGSPARRRETAGG